MENPQGQSEKEVINSFNDQNQAVSSEANLSVRQPEFDESISELEIKNHHHARALEALQILQRVFDLHQPLYTAQYYREDDVLKAQIHKLQNDFEEFERGIFNSPLIVNERKCYHARVKLKQVSSEDDLIPFFANTDEPIKHEDIPSVLETFAFNFENYLPTACFIRTGDYTAADKTLIFGTFVEINGKSVHLHIPVCQIESIEELSFEEILEIQKSKNDNL